MKVLGLGAAPLRVFEGLGLKSPLSNHLRPDTHVPKLPNPSVIEKTGP